MTNPFKIMMGECEGCSGPMLSAMLRDQHIMFYLSMDGEIRFYKNRFPVGTVAPTPEAIKWIESWYSECRHPEMVINYTVGPPGLPSIACIESLGMFMQKLRKHGGVK